MTPPTCCSNDSARRGVREACREVDDDPVQHVDARQAMLALPLLTVPGISVSVPPAVSVALPTAVPIPVPLTVAVAIAVAVPLAIRVAVAVAVALTAFATVATGITAVPTTVSATAA